MNFKEIETLEEIKESWATNRDFRELEYPPTWREFFEKNIKNLPKLKILPNIIFPSRQKVLRIFWELPPEAIRVVILGQDPYHAEPNQAQGLAFSVPDGLRIPPSLRNIFKELMNEKLISEIPKSGNLISWVHQGVFLLNTSLTVYEKMPNSHQKHWANMTDKAISYISENAKKPIVFILWGSYAQSKEIFIKNKKIKHKIIKTSHPSPLSASRGFFGSDCFKECNKFLDTPIKF